ncbi:hypothetical protein LCGC14_1485000 [marine sediment metagenome]|uniref:Uncharacterized protein n=1 Tax=marine sediment metagenome TaxID=412755 RepID=A0A0F9LNX9_9ZZZZ
MEAERIVKRALAAYEILVKRAIDSGVAVEATIDASPDTLRRFIEHRLLEEADRVNKIWYPPKPATSCPHPLGPIPDWIRKVWRAPLYHPGDRR